MSNADRDLEMLDKLLEEAASDPAVEALRERARDSGHVDPELMQEFAAGRLIEEEQTNVRRHLLFCDDCTKLILAHGGEVDDEESVTATPQETRSRARTRPRALPLVLLGLIGVAAILVLVLIKPPVPHVPAVRNARIHSLVRGPLAEFVVQPDERLAISLEVVDAQKLHVYVLAMAPDGVWHKLEPTRSSAEPTDVTRTVWLPRGAEPGATERKSWQMSALSRSRPADHFGIFVLLSETRIPVLEGDQLAAATLPRFEADFAAKHGRHDRDHVERVGAKLEEMGLAPIVVTLALRVEPL